MSKSMKHELATDEIHASVYLASPLIEKVESENLGDEIKQLDICEYESAEKSEAMETGDENKTVEYKDNDNSVNFEATESFRGVLEMADTDESDELQPDAVGTSRNELRAFEI